jgi:hypothetical protein
VRVLWRLYNHQLAHVIRRIPAANLDVRCQVVGQTADAVTLSYLVQDYVVHLRHHLKQIEEQGARIGSGVM